MTLLSQFLLRLAFGLAVGMAITSPRQVASGYFRNHLYVILGLTTLAALVGTKISWIVAASASAAALLSYIGSVCWLYEAKRLGISMLWFTFWTAFLAAHTGLSIRHETIAAPDMADVIITTVDPLDAFHTIALLTSGLVLGFTMAAMLLGHWYLNSPGMELAPLRWLLAAAAIAVGAQMLVSGIGLAAEISSVAHTSSAWWMFVALRWLFGLLGVLVLICLAWQTLKIPNTQSATGILYVAVIGTFVGELTSMLLSAESLYPL